MAWKSVDYLKDRLKLPVISCCYVIYIEDNLVYIGSTNNLRNRFSGHAFRYGYAKEFITPWGEFPDDIKFIIKYKPSKIWRLANGRGKAYKKDSACF